MNSQEREAVKSNLRKLKTVQQMFDYLGQNYDLTEPLGTLTHTAFIAGIDKALVMTNPKPKRK